MRARILVLVLSILVLARDTDAAQPEPDFYVSMTSCLFVFARDGAAQSTPVGGHTLSCSRSGRKIACDYHTPGDSEADHKIIAMSVVSEGSGETTYAQGNAGADYLQVNPSLHTATSTMRYSPTTNGIFGVRFCTGTFLTAWEVKAALTESGQ